MIELKNINVKFTSKSNIVHAVKNVDLKVEQRDIYGIVGFSGAGKSTLIRTINLLQPPTSGQVIINGEDITTYNAKQLRNRRKKIGMIFQHFNLLNAKNVFDNVAFPLKQSSLSKEEKTKKVRELLNFVGIADKELAYPSQLSGGQKQRVAIARALANAPDILLCDEATSALDPQTTDEVLSLLKNLNEKLSLTIVIITHEMKVVKDICNKVAVMENGHIIENGDIVQVFSRPQQPLTKAFINTATQMDSALENVINHKNMLHLNPDALVTRISYVGDTTAEPLVSKLTSLYDLSVNILSGNIEIIQETAIGMLIITLSGSDESKIKGLRFLESQNVTVEIVNVGKLNLNSKTHIKDYELIDSKTITNVKEGKMYGLLS